MIRYFAVLDDNDRNTVRNVFVVDDGIDPVAMVVYDHRAGHWVQNTALLDFIAGDRTNERTEIDRARADALAREWGISLPSQAEMRELARAAG